MFNIHSFKCSIHATRSNIPTIILILSIDTFNKFNICANSLYWISIVHQQKGKWERLHQGCTSSQFRFKNIEVLMKIDRNIKIDAILLVYQSIATRIIWSAPTSDVDRLAIAVEYSFVRVLCGELSITRGHFFPWQGPPNYALVLLCELEMFWFLKQKTSLKKDCLLFKVGKCFWRHIAIGTSPRQYLLWMILIYWYILLRRL